MSFVSIHNAIKSKLESLMPVTLKEVYGEKINPLEHEFAKFPVAELIESRNESDYLSTKENMRVYAYEIYVYQGIEEAGGVSQAYDNLRSVVDTILNTFDNDQDLGGVVDWVEPSFAGFADFSKRNKTIAVAIITIKCHKSILLN